MTDPSLTQEWVDRFYVQHGPCCAGCDWWRSINTLVGECHRSTPVDGQQRETMLGIKSCSLPLEAGHIFTPLHHHCGEFRDEFDWASLPLVYRRRIGHPSAGREEG